jgi:hypothetical protein
VYSEKFYYGFVKNQNDITSFIFGDTNQINICLKNVKTNVRFCNHSVQQYGSKEFISAGKNVRQQGNN